MSTTAKREKQYSPALPQNGNKTGNHHQSTGEHREGRRFECIGGRV
jgi:hypothetical protein